MDAARQADAGFWDATTSFIIAQSPLDTTTFGKRLTAGLDSKKDMVVVFDPTDMSMAYFGAVNQAEILRSFFTTPIKLT